MERLIQNIIEKEFEKKPEDYSKIDTGLIHRSYTFHVDGESYVLQLSGSDDEENKDLSHCLNCYRLFSDADIPVPELLTDSVKEQEGQKYIIVEKLPGKNN